MTLGARIESALEAALDGLDGRQTPPRLAAAIRHAVFPGGGRVRPRLCVAVAHACGDWNPGATDVSATALELLHCASLVHDDLPCFDDAAMRRGIPSVHAAYGEQTAVLVGDALIVMAFELLSRISNPTLLSALLTIIAESVGPVRGIIAGQAWETENRAELRRYHRQKTGSLFEAAVTCGALTGGGHPEAWRTVGRGLGEAYQVADDLRDVLGDARSVGKPIGQDATHGRPNAARSLGVDGASVRLEALLDQVIAAVPGVPGHAGLTRWLSEVCGQLYPTRNPPTAAAAM